MANLHSIAADLDDARHQAAIRELIRGYARDPMGNGCDLPDEIVERLVPGLREHPATEVFLAFDGAEPVGIAVCFVGFSTFAGRRLINVHDLAVAPERRRLGVGRLLLERVEQRARELDCCRITLEVRAGNTPARALYRSFGFADLEFGSGPDQVLFQSKRL